MKAIPDSHIALEVSTTFVLTAATAIIAADSTVLAMTSVSRLNAWRMRGRKNTALIAPPPMQASSSVNTPAPPPPCARATSGSSAIRAVEWKNDAATRASTAFTRLECRANCRPTRIAPPIRSRPSGLGTCVRRQRMITKPEITDSTAFSTNTYALPRLAMMAPAASGPAMRDAFIATPFKASAAGNCARGTSSGTIAENTGQRMARPMPLANVSASSTGGVMASARITAHRIVATTATQNCVMMK
jgi:hypothetical protein